MEKSSHIVGPIKDKYFLRIELQWMRPPKRPAWISATADIFIGVPSTSGSSFVQRVVSGGPHRDMLSAKQKVETEAQKKIDMLAS